jgi:hypothetical protein
LATVSPPFLAPNTSAWSNTPKLWTRASWRGARLLLRHGPANSSGSTFGADVAKLAPILFAIDNSLIPSSSVNPIAGSELQTMADYDRRQGGGGYNPRKRRHRGKQPAPAPVPRIVFLPQALLACDATVLISLRHLTDPSPTAQRMTTTNIPTATSVAPAAATSPPSRRACASRSSTSPTTPSAASRRRSTGSRTSWPRTTTTSGCAQTLWT